MTNTQRISEITERLNAVGRPHWGATYDDYHEDEGSHWELRLGDGRTVVLHGGYDEWRPVLDLITNAPADLAHLLSLVEKLQGQLDT